MSLCKCTCLLVEDFVAISKLNGHCLPTTVCHWIDGQHIGQCEPVSLGGGRVVLAGLARMEYFHSADLNEFFVLWAFFWHVDRFNWSSVLWA